MKRRFALLASFTALILAAAMIGGCGRPPTAAPSDSSQGHTLPQPDASIPAPAPTAAVGSAASVPTPPIIIDPRELFRRSVGSVVLIRTFDENNTPLAIGSGFFVNADRELVTNAHVLEGASRVEYVGSNNIPIPVTECWAINPDRDIAILVATGPVLHLAEHEPVVGDRVFVIGNPEGLIQTLSDGLVSSLRQFAGASVIQITAPISPGSSGGPVLDTTGAVVGIASYSYREGQNLNLAIPASYVAQLRTASTAESLAAVLTRLKVTLGAARAQSAHGRVTVTRVQSNQGNADISLENDESYPVGAVWVRVLYYEDTAGERTQQIAQIDQQIAAADIARSQFAQAIKARRTIEAYLHVLQTDPQQWTYQDLAKIPRDMGVPVMIFGAGEHYVETREEGSLRMIQAELPRELARVQDLLAAGQQNLEQGAASWEERKSQLLDQRANLAKTGSQPELRKLIDYADYKLELNIAPGLTKASLIKLGRSEPWEVKVIDYELVKAN